MAQRRRRGVGISGLQRLHQHKETFSLAGSQLEEERVKWMQQQLGLFRENLAKFAAKYKKEINKNPEFRQQFQSMCASIGVDPLASNKGFWAELLGVGNFYYELAVQIVDVCLRTRPTNGGLIELSELQKHLEKMRVGLHQQTITRDDIERAIKKLNTLGNGFKILPVGCKLIVQSVPCELSSDHSAVLSLAQDTFYVTQGQLRNELGWVQHRIDAVLVS
ncbi:ESCRT-II subunit protein snf8, variant 2 [Balamuthia mandrillaris]